MCCNEQQENPRLCDHSEITHEDQQEMQVHTMQYLPEIIMSLPEQVSIKHVARTNC
jgi:hypothetical protein